MRRSFLCNWFTIDKFRLAVCAGIICFAIFLVYFPAIQGGFIWDDDYYVTKNPLLTSLDGLKRIWFSTDAPSQYFPLTYTSFWLEHALWGLNPVGYHIVNVALHLINALLVWFLLYRLSIPGAWLASAIFALHPVHIESVAWITERKNLLSCMFYLLAIMTWLQFSERTTVKPWRYYLLSIFLFTLALFSKTTACMLPTTLLLIEWFKNGHVSLRYVLYVLPFIVLGLIMGLLTMWWEYNLIGTQGVEFSFTIMEKVLIASRAIWFYPYKLVWPTNLTFSYPRWDIDTASILQYAWPLVSLLFFILVWIKRRTLGRGVLAAILFYIFNIAPMLGFISLYTFRYTFVADHYQYVATIGIIAMFAAFINKWQERSVLAQPVFVPLIVLSLGVLTWQQGHIYKDEGALWHDTLKKNPASWMAHNNLANFLRNNGKIKEAIYHHTESLRLNPKSTGAYNDRGISYAALGNYKNAIDDFDKAIELIPNEPKYYYNRGLTYYNWGKYLRAIADLNRAVELKPRYSEAYYIMALAYSKAGYDDQANRNFNLAARLGLNKSSGVKRSQINELK